MRLALGRQRSEGINWPRDGTVVLHVGCGPRVSGVLPEQFNHWHEVRLDIAPEVQPDIVANIVAMPELPSSVVDAIWSSHNLEHVFAHEVPLALGEFRRVLKPGGTAYIQVPDVLVPARAIARGQLERTVYESDAGPVTALDMLFGYGPAIAGGEHHMAHRTAFTRQTLSRKLADAGFSDVRVESRKAALWATAVRPVSGSAEPPQPSGST